MSCTHFGLLKYLGELPLLCLQFLFPPEASSLEGMLPSTLITAVAILARRYMEGKFSLGDSTMMPARRSMEDGFSLGDSAMLRNLCHK